MIDLLYNLTAVLWRQSWQLIILVALVWPVAHFSQRRYPRFTYLLWLMVALKTLIPLRLTSPVPLGINLSATQTLFTAPEVSAWVSDSTIFQPTVIIGSVWLILVLLMGIRLLITERHFRNSLIDLEDFNIPGLPNLIRKFKLGKSVRIALSDQITIPLTLGFRNPIILLPARLHQTDAKDLYPVIAHELAHIQRRDIWAIGMQVTLNILFFFHPFMRIVNRQLDLNRERICDELAIQALGMQPRSYGQELLHHIEASLMPRPQAIMSGGLFMNKKNVLKRFEFLMDRKGGTMLKIKWEQKLIFGMVALVMGILSCSDGIENGMDNDPVSPEAVAKEINNTYDVAPEPLGGYAAIQKAVVYPELARKAGIQGTVFVQVTIGADGKTRSTEILEGIPDSGLDEAAANALMSVSWKPGMFKGKPVALRMAVPVVFKLKEK